MAWLSSMCRVTALAGVVWLAGSVRMTAQTVATPPVDPPSVAGQPMPTAGQPRPAAQAADIPTSSGGGWVFTPTLSWGLNWDDNILLQGRGEDTRKDVLNALSPRGVIDYRNKRTQFSGVYDGNVLLYARVNELNAYEQRASGSVRRILTRKVTLFAANNFAVSPTTSLVEIVGAPFVRLGSRIDDARGGVEVALSKASSLTAAYTFQWVSFGNPFLDEQTPLRGGHSHGATVSYRHRLNGRTSLTADGDLQHALIAGFAPEPAVATAATAAGPTGSTLADPNGPGTFDLLNGTVGLERRASARLTYSGALGISRLGLSTTGTTRMAPMWRLGLSRQFEKGVVDVGYSRSFVPSYGFGGTVQNEQVTGVARAPLGRRLNGHASLAWRRNEALVNTDPSLWSWWIEGGIGYRLRPWLQLDAFYASDRQRIDRPGGDIVRNRVGVQLSTGRVVRIH